MGKPWLCIKSRGGSFLANKCYLCHFEEETINLIFLFTVQRQEFYGGSFFTLFGVSWVLFSSVKGTFLWWYESFLGKVHKRSWRAVSFGLFGRKGTC